jgi:uncharacterized membrane protein
VSATTARFAPKLGGRVDAVDFARGAALIGMAMYHLTWDMADFQLVTPTLPFSPPMRLFSHVVASAFLALVGISLALAHPQKLNLPAFWRRLGIVGGAAALVTAASFVFAPGETIWFGILHCIAAASLVALPFIETPATASLVAGAAAIAIPFFVQTSLFNPPALLWLGLGTALPNTVDWRPLLPWAGVVFLGLAIGRTPPVMKSLISPARWRPKSPLSRAICFGGRHSLAVYLVHQPILIGLVAAIAHSEVVAAAPGSKPDYRVFVASCVRVCEEKGRLPDDCETSCRCVADAIDRSGEAERLGASTLDEKRKADLKRMAEACMGP